MNAQDKIEKLQNELNELKKELNKREFEIGKWYIGEDNHGIYLFNYNGESHAFGFYHDYWQSEWYVGESSDGWGVDLRQATATEIETALRKEAERRGFKKGVKYKGALYGHEEKIKSEFNYFSHGEKEYLTDGYGDSVYHNGNWAEIIEDEKFFDWDVEYDDSLVRIGCKDYSKNFLLELQSALSYLSNKNVSEVIDELKKLKL